MELFETLASQPGMGHIRRCPHGCLHLTYGTVSLHFPEQDRFTSFTYYLCGLKPDAEGHALVRYDWITLALHCCALKELQDLAYTALQRIEKVQGNDLSRPLYFIT